ncbi:hypothetical protein FOTG_11815 [Fusarium oxysporum f. sp. vasinfectum 25433]|uniref:Major facilitator superfamily (MFS) profile domain-containing protein n=1 Tax=Fusarium oxysporum f. sp. vasinfectum 25433 TaxID=1089449 RepID=X0MI20_FUSOX|nr:hypothetical protein FOTG_11815 [Fusarium oxysporum f. sp. vasinfectum 25433]
MFGTSLGMIFAGSFLNGICYVFYFGLAPTYGSEVWPLHIVIGSGLCLCPESPWHLAHKGKLAQAEKSLKSLAIVDGAKIVAQMGKTNRLEKETLKSTMFFDCSKGHRFDAPRSPVCRFTCRSSAETSSLLC